MGIIFDGEFTVTAPRSRVYSFLADPRKFAPCLPTYKALDMRDDRNATVTVAVGVGKIRGNATVQLELTEEIPPQRAAYAGKGKILGSVFNLATSFDLEDAEGGGTKVRWSGDLSMFGKLVALAGGLIRPLARKDIESLIGAIQSALNADA